MGSIPLPALSIQPPQTDPLGQYGKLMQLRDLIQRQQLIPGELQGQQQQLQAGAMQNQLQQIGLKNAQIANEAMTDPQFKQRYQDWQTKQTSGAPGSQEPVTTSGQASAVQSPVPLHPYAQFLMDEYGLPLQGPHGALEVSNALIDSSTKAAALNKDDLANYGTQVGNFRDAVTPVLAEQDPVARAAQVQNLQKNIAQNPSKYPPQIAQNVNKLSDPNYLQMASNLESVHSSVIEYATKQAQQREATAGAEAKENEIAAPTPARIDTFTKTTLPSFLALTPGLRASYMQQAQQARTVPEFNKVVEQADATDKSLQMHADSLAQTKAIVGDRFTQNAIEANEKNWTDPQHGYQAVSSAARLTKQTLQAGADGNGLAASMGPMMTVLGINSFNQTHRINPAEAQAANLPGGYVERFNAWADKSFTGKLSPQLATEGQSLMDGIINAAHSRAVQNSQLIASRPGVNITPAQMPAMDKDGNLTKLDQVAATHTPAAVQPGIIARPPNATHTGISSVDGKTYWLDANQNKLGLVK